MGRALIDPPAPKGYPYRLYMADYTYVLAVNRQDAMRKMNTNNVKGVKVLDLISANGHTETANILKNIGDNWVCKEGRIYYAL